MQPIAEMSPERPVHSASLKEVFAKIIPDQPEGQIWLLVYDFKTLMQQLVGTVFFHKRTFGTHTHTLELIIFVSEVHKKAMAEGSCD